MADIFISYKRCRRPIVERLASALQAHGWEVWFDARLTEGERFRQEIETELANARCALVIWCDESINSDFVLDEAGWAKTQNCLIQALWMPVSPPLGFGQHQAVNIVGWQRGVPALTNLIKAIERVIGEPSQPSRGPMGTPNATAINSEIARTDASVFADRLRALEGRLEQEQEARAVAEKEISRLQALIESANKSAEVDAPSNAGVVTFPAEFFVNIAESLLDGSATDPDNALLTFAMWEHTPQGSDFWSHESLSLRQSGALSNGARKALQEMIAVAKITGKYTITESVPLAAAPLFSIGNRIFHQKFGYGVVRRIEGAKLTVDFDTVGEKRVIDAFVIHASAA